MKTNVYDLAGKIQKEVQLPKEFESEVKERLINRAYISSLTKKIQPKGVFGKAGRQTTARYKGVRRVRNSLIAIGKARKPRTTHAKNLVQGRVAGLPGVVGGPRAHPPKVETVIAEKINKKEKKLALYSALAAITNKELVRSKHVFDTSLTLPIIWEEKAETLAKTKDIYNALATLKLNDDVENAKAKKNIRAGKGKMRGRKYNRKKSILFVVSDSKSPLGKAARNLEGVDVTTVRSLSVEKLAPGGKPGRLVVFTETAMNKMR